MYPIFSSNNSSRYTIPQISYWQGSWKAIGFLLLLLNGRYMKQNWMQQTHLLANHEWWRTVNSSSNSVTRTLYEFVGACDVITNLPPRSPAVTTDQAVKEYPIRILGVLKLCRFEYPSFGLGKTLVFPFFAVVVGFRFLIFASIPLESRIQMNYRLSAVGVSHPHHLLVLWEQKARALCSRGHIHYT